MCAEGLELLQGYGGGGHEGNCCFSPRPAGGEPHLGSDHLFEFLVLVSLAVVRRLYD